LRFLVRQAYTSGEAVAQKMHAQRAGIVRDFLPEVPSGTQLPASD
jgi:hypothetical protein